MKGFGLTLALGIICDIVMMLLFKAPLIRLLAPRVIARHPGFWDLKDSQEAHRAYAALAEVEGVSTSDAEIGEAMNRAITDRVAGKREEEGSRAVAAVRALKGRFIKHDIGFMKGRRVLLAVLAVLVAASIAVVGVKGMSFGIEFVGGTSVTFSNTDGVTADRMNQALRNAGVNDATVQTTQADGQRALWSAPPRPMRRFPAPPPTRWLRNWGCPLPISRYPPSDPTGAPASSAHRLSRFWSRCC